MRGAVGLADNLRPRVGRGHGLAGEGGEPTDQPVEPTVVVGLQHHGLGADQDVRLDMRDLLPVQSAPGLDAGPVEPVEAIDLGRFVVAGVKVAVLTPHNRGLALHRLEQRLAVAQRPAELDVLDRLLVGRLVDQLADYGQIDGLRRGTSLVDPAAEGRPGRCMVAEPEPAEPEIPVRGMSRHGIGGEQIKSGRCRAPEPFMRPSQRPVELLALWPSQTVRRLRERIGLLQPGRDQRIGLQRAQR